MASQTFDDPSLGAEPAAEGVHNSVLIRTPEPTRSTHSWVVPTLIGVAILGGGLIWGFMATHPAAPVVNHAVSDAPSGFATGAG